MIDPPVLKVAIVVSLRVYNGFSSSCHGHFLNVVSISTQIIQLKMLLSFQVLGLLKAVCKNEHALWMYSLFYTRLANSFLGFLKFYTLKMTD